MPSAGEKTFTVQLNRLQTWISGGAANINIFILPLIIIPSNGPRNFWNTRIYPKLQAFWVGVMVRFVHLVRSHCIISDLRWTNALISTWFLYIREGFRWVFSPRKHCEEGWNVEGWLRRCQTDLSNGLQPCTGPVRDEWGEWTTTCNMFDPGSFPRSTFHSLPVN